MGLKPPIVARAVVHPTDLTLVSSPGEESNQKLVGAAPGTLYEGSGPEQCKDWTVVDVMVSTPGLKPSFPTHTLMPKV